MHPLTRRVLVVSPQPFYEDRGTPIAVRQLLQALTELDYEVDLLTYPVGATVDIPGVRYVRSANPFGVKRVPIGLSIGKLLLDASLVPALAVLLARRRYACMHALEEAAFPAVLLGRRFGVPVIYDMQSSLPEQLAQYRAFRPRPMQALLRRSERWLLERADSVVSSSGLARRARALAPAARLAEWRYPSPLPPAAPGEAEALRQELGIGPDEPVVLYSGSFAPYQGLADLVAAIPAVRRQVPPAAFVLVGADGAAGGDLGCRCADLVAAGALRVLPRQPHARMPAFLALADVVVSPRAWGDNLPLKVFDYLAAGKPIVATDIPAHRAVLDESRALLCGLGAAPVAAAVTRLLRDRDLAARLAAAGRAWAEEQIGWVAFVRAVGELYGGIEAVA